MHITKIFVATSLASVMFACAHDNSNNDASHLHDETLQLTAYNDSFELFAQVTPFVAGQASEITAHFSNLTDFKPVVQAKVTASLITGESGIRQTLDSPSKPGIYAFSLTPETTGASTLVFDIETTTGNSRISIPGVIIFDNEHIAHESAAETAVTSSNGVSFTKEQSWKIDFATAIIEPAPFGQVIRTTAQILPTQGDETIITSKTSGIVSFTMDNVVEGKAVTAGQSLFLINSGDMADDNLSVRYSEAVTQYNKAKTDYERKKELAKDKIVSQGALLEAESAYLNAQTVYNNLKKNFSSGQQNVSSLMTGFVKQVLVRNGEYVVAGQPVVVISKNLDLLVTANLQPKYYSLLGDIATANIRIMDTGEAYSLDELGGSIVSYGKTADAQNPLIPVTFRIKNNGKILPGSFVEMFISTRKVENILSVPNEAIVEQMGSYFVFVQLTAEYLEKRAVSTGVKDGFRIAITQGLNAGERVVTKGAVYVKLAQAAGAVDPHSGHAH